jgi:hypothetical protein
MPRPKLSWRQRQALAEADAREWDARAAAKARAEHLTGVTICWADRTAIAWIDGEPAGSFESYDEALEALPPAAQARIAAEARAGAAAFFARLQSAAAPDPEPIDRLQASLDHWRL